MWTSLYSWIWRIRLRSTRFLPITMWTTTKDTIIVTMNLTNKRMWIQPMSPYINLKMKSIRAVYIKWIKWDSFIVVTNQKPIWHQERSRSLWKTLGFISHKHTITKMQKRKGSISLLLKISKTLHLMMKICLMHRTLKSLVTLKSIIVRDQVKS